MLARTLTRLALSLAAMIAALAAIGLALAQSPLTPTGTYTYPGAAPCDTTLQACLDGLSAGDVLNILPGEYTATLTLSKAVSLIGAEPALPTVLIAPNSQRVLSISGPTVNNSVVISGLHIVGGDLTGGNKCPANCGGGIYIYDGAWPTLANLVITGGHAYQGGGLYIDQTGQAQGAITIAHSQIISNSAVDSGGGLYLSAGTVT
ncbi:MAG TPA: hypothetical protein VMP08_17615, partial [Anaerolineae bacterium]|nr:hypothetical protein [Anaerolineae bacterium]